MISAIHESAPAARASSLAVWITSGVLLYVLLGSLALLWIFENHIRREEQRAFEELSRVNTRFLERSRLPQTANMAAQLGEIIGAQVFFLHERTSEVIGKKGDVLPQTARGMRFDGKTQAPRQDQWMVGLDGPNDTKVVFVRPAFASIHVMSHSDTWLALGIFWLLSLALGWAMAKRITAPLRDMAKSLPFVGTGKPLPELPVTRRDEIGQLALTLTRTHETLRSERERRRAAERHALLGRMAASLAHEVRNPVASIRLHAQLLEGAGAEEAALSRGLIESEAGRIEQMVSQWLHHARPEPPVLAQVDITEALRHAVELMEPQARHSNVIFERGSGLDTPCVIPADRHRLQQVFGNVLRNAVQAMPTGGTIGLRVIDSASSVTVVFEDGGTGFSASALEKAAEPFYSEKEGGMGLGLAVASEICLAHGGRLEVENNPDKGALVRAVFSKNPNAFPSDKSPPAP